MAGHGLALVLRRNQHYWEAYQKLALYVVLLILLVLLLMGFALYQRLSYPKPRYFATTPDGRPIPIVPLVEAYQSTDFVLNWAKNAVLDIYSLDFVTWRKSLQDIAVYFTLKGYADFMVALQDSTNLEAIKAKKQVVTAEATGPLVLIRQGIYRTDAAIYSWDIQMPIKITYQNSENEIIVQTGTIIMQVSRDSTLRHPEGLAIQQLVLQAAQ